MQLPTSQARRPGGHGGPASAAGTDLGRDADELSRVIHGMPDAAARGAFARTLRSVVDWRGQVVTMRDRAYLTDEVPVLLVWGAHDGIIPVRHAELAAAAMPNARAGDLRGGRATSRTTPTRSASSHALVDFVARPNPPTTCRPGAGPSCVPRVRSGVDHEDNDGPDLTLLG